MSQSYNNPQDERDEVRANCGGAGEGNLAEVDIDSALSMANEETTERTGLAPDDPRLPHLRRKLKVLIATSYLIIRFSNLVDVRASIMKEITQLTSQMTTLESTTGDDESLISSIDDIDEFGHSFQNINYWGGFGGGTRRSIPIGANRHRYGRYTDFKMIREIY